VIILILFMGMRYYIQTANINLENDEWIPIGVGYDRDGSYDANKVFYGVYNGNGKYIRNLNVAATAINAGLFGIVDGTESAKIYKLVVYGSINSDSVLYAGGIAGQLINN
jgi:hypothetical protein